MVGLAERRQRPRRVQELGYSVHCLRRRTARVLCILNYCAILRIEWLRVHERTLIDSAEYQISLSIYKGSSTLTEVEK